MGKALGVKWRTTMNLEEIEKYEEELSANLPNLFTKIVQNHDALCLQAQEALILLHCSEMDINGKWNLYLELFDKGILGTYYRWPTIIGLGSICPIDDLYMIPNEVVDVDEILFRIEGKYSEEHAEIFMNWCMNGRYEKIYIL